MDELAEPPSASRPCDAGPRPVLFPPDTHCLLVRTIERVRQACLQGSWYVFLEIGFPELFSIPNVFSFRSFLLLSPPALGSVPFQDLPFISLATLLPDTHLRSHTLHFTWMAFSISSVLTYFIRSSTKQSLAWPGTADLSLSKSPLAFCTQFWNITSYGWGGG